MCIREEGDLSQPLPSILQSVPTRILESLEQHAFLLSSLVARGNASPSPACRSSGGISELGSSGRGVGQAPKEQGSKVIIS